MVEIHVYGKLRSYVKDPQRSSDQVVRLEPRPAETLASLLAAIAIPVEEINHIFLNAKLFVTRTRTATYLDYAQSRSSLSDWNLDVAVGSGDRIGLFGSDMAILGM